MVKGLRNIGILIVTLFTIIIFSTMVIFAVLKGKSGSLMEGTDDPVYTSNPAGVIAVDMDNDPSNPKYSSGVAGGYTGAYCGYTVTITDGSGNVLGGYGPVSARYDGSDLGGNGVSLADFKSRFGGYSHDSGIGTFGWPMPTLGSTGGAIENYLIQPQDDYDYGTFKVAETLFGLSQEDCYALAENNDEVFMHVELVGVCGKYNGGVWDGTKYANTLFGWTPFKNNLTGKLSTVLNKMARWQYYNENKCGMSAWDRSSDNYDQTGTGIVSVYLVPGTYQVIKCYYTDGALDKTTYGSSGKVYDIKDEGSYKVTEWSFGKKKIKTMTDREYDDLVGESEATGHSGSGPSTEEFQTPAKEVVLVIKLERDEPEVVPTGADITLYANELCYVVPYMDGNRVAEGSIFAEGDWEPYTYEECFNGFKDSVVTKGPCGELWQTMEDEVGVLAESTDPETNTFRVDDGSGGPVYRSPWLLARCEEGGVSATPVPNHWNVFASDYCEYCFEEEFYDVRVYFIEGEEKSTDLGRPYTELTPFWSYYLSRSNEMGVPDTNYVLSEYRDGPKEAVAEITGFEIGIVGGPHGNTVEATHEDIWWHDTTTFSFNATSIIRYVMTPVYVVFVPEETGVDQMTGEPIFEDVPHDTYKPGEWDTSRPSSLDNLIDAPVSETIFEKSLEDEAYSYRAPINPLATTSMAGAEPYHSSGITVGDYSEVRGYTVVTDLAPMTIWPEVCMTAFINEDADFYADHPAEHQVYVMGEYERTLRPSVIHGYVATTIGENGRTTLTTPATGEIANRLKGQFPDTAGVTYMGTSFDTSTDFTGVLDIYTVALDWLPDSNGVHGTWGNTMIDTASSHSSFVGEIMDKFAYTLIMEVETSNGHTAVFDLYTSEPFEEYNPTYENVEYWFKGGGLVEGEGVAEGWASNLYGPDLAQGGGMQINHILDTMFHSNCDPDNGSSAYEGHVDDIYWEYECAPIDGEHWYDEECYHNITVSFYHDHYEYGDIMTTDKVDYNWLSQGLESVYQNTNDWVLCKIYARMHGDDEKDSITVDGYTFPFYSTYLLQHLENGDFVVMNQTNAQMQKKN